MQGPLAAVTRHTELTTADLRHKHTAEVALETYHTYFFQNCQKAHWTLEEWPATSRATQGTHFVVYWEEVSWSPLATETLVASGDDVQSGNT